MIGAVAGVVFVAAVGALPAWRVVTRPLEAAVLSPLAGAVVLVPGGVAAVATATSPLPWTVLGVAAANGWAWRTGRARPAWTPSSPIGPVLATLAVFCFVAVTFLTRPPVDWDAHSIWLYHSHWFAVGGSTARDAFALESFSHAEYPPLLTASAGIASRVVRGDLDWRVAQAVIAAVSWSALASAGAVLIDGARRVWVTAVGVVALAAVAVDSVGFGVANAEADFAAAATVVLAAVALLVRDDPALVPLGLIGATAAALCKGESLVAVCVVLAMAWFRRGRPLELRWAGPVAAGVAWAVVARLLGAESYLAGDGAGLSLERVVDRAWPSLRRVVEEMSPMVLAAALASAGCAALLASSRKPLALLWAAVAANVASLVLVYVIGDLRLDSWLASSAPRVATGPALLAAVASVVAIDRCADLALSREGASASVLTTAR